MNDVTLLSVNWNQQPALELMLKSYLEQHGREGIYRLMLIDNGSTDGSKEWLYANEIPFIDLPENIGHENALNIGYANIMTHYCMLVDTDVEFFKSMAYYVSLLNHSSTYISVGELITGDQLGAPIRPRIGPWSWLFDIWAMKEKKVEHFRDPKVTDWSYDVGSWFWEQMQKHGFKNVNTPRAVGHIDNDLFGMNYGHIVHFGKVSWDLEKHQDRHDEVVRRREYIKRRIRVFRDIELRKHFI